MGVMRLRISLRSTELEAQQHEREEEEEGFIYLFLLSIKIIKNLYRLRCFFFNGPSDFVSEYYFCAFPLLSSGL
jgi:hypothetical protein